MSDRLLITIAHTPIGVNLPTSTPRHLHVFSPLAGYYRFRLILLIPMMRMPLRLAVASMVLLLFMTVVVTPTYGVPCSSQHLAVFKAPAVSGPLNKCMSSSEVTFPMPPKAELTKSQVAQICDERECKEMIAAVDDLDVPRCDILFNGKNMTLQMSLDSFTAMCDAPRTMAPKKKTPKRDGSGEASTAAVASSLAAAVTMLMVVASIIVQ